jgi:ankyrin repeat protein
MDSYTLSLTDWGAYVNKVKAEPELVDECTNSGISVLHLSVHYNQKDLFEFLMASGANFNVKDYTGNTPLHFAVFRQTLWALKHLALCANINEKNKSGETPLLLICKLSQYISEIPIDTSDFVFESINTLLRAGADPNITDKLGRSPLFYITHSDLFQDFVNYGANINSKDEEGITLLMINIQRYVINSRNKKETATDNSLKILELILSNQNVRLNETDKNRKTALHWAISLKSLEVVKLLHDLSPDRLIKYNARDNNRRTPLDIAYYYNDKDMISLLVELIGSNNNIEL